MVTHTTPKIDVFLDDLFLLRYLPLASCARVR
jgi:hypothetical protein